MAKPLPISNHEECVRDYYTDHTEKSYMAQWDDEDIHLGLFQEGESILFHGLIPAHDATRKRGIKRMTETVVKPAQIQSSDIVVDAGCGIGGTAIHLAKTYGCHVTGINICQHQLDIAAKKIEGAGLTSHIQLQYADCSQHLPFPDHSVDVIVNIESACHYSNRRQFLKECARILRPGGRLVAQDVVYSSHTSTEDYQKWIVPLCNAWRLHPLETPETYRSILEESGLNVSMLINLYKEVRPNFDHMHNAALLIEKHSTSLTEDEHLRLTQCQTVAAAYFQGVFTVIHYLAVRP